MNPPRFHVRRATLDDLENLRQLWQMGQLAPDILEKSFTEFQVVESDVGELLGAVGLRLEGHHGKLHSEVFVRPEQEEDLRPLLWERLQLVARNHGLARLWTQEPSPFWRQVSFQEPSAELLSHLPESFGDRQGAWRTLQLREEVKPAISLDHEFELFMQHQSESTAQLMRRARRLKLVATLVAFVLLGLVVAAAIYAIRHVPPVRMH